MDEGLTLKMCTSILHATIAEATDLYKMNTTSVSHTYVLLWLINVCFNVPLTVAFNVPCNVGFNVGFNVEFMLHLMLHLLLHLMLHLMLH